MAAPLLVLGGAGMLGHAVIAAAAARGIDVRWTTRGHRPATLADTAGWAGALDATDTAAVDELLQQLRPGTVVNCIGAVKQRREVAAAEMIRVNAVFPHDLATAAARTGTRVIQISSDCVFAGEPGDRPHGYTERDRPDATDVYGRSKALGELDQPGTLTLRTSMIGPELSRGLGLLAWFRAANEPVVGFTRATFSGLTTDELARLLLDVVLPRPELSGVLNVAGPAISKHDLVVLLRDRWRPGLEITADDQVVVDRRLDAAAFAAATGYASPSWPEMLDALLARGGGRP